MPQTRMFRDRVVSMEQTLEGGEKNLELLKSICREAFPDFSYHEHGLDHERDLFVMTLQASDGRRKSIGWTRMVLFDPERIPAMIADPLSPLRSKLVGFLRSRALRPEVVVTFRHLEEGWIDTPEPKREKKRGRRGGRAAGPRAPQSGGAQPQVQKQKGAPRPTPVRGVLTSSGERRLDSLAPRPAESEQPRVRVDAQPSTPGRRRRFRRRRRGRGGSGSHSPPGPAPGPVK